MCGAHDAIYELTAYRDPNLIPIKCFYEPDPKVRRWELVKLYKTSWDSTVNICVHLKPWNFNVFDILYVCVCVDLGSLLCCIGYWSKFFSKRRTVQNHCLLVMWAWWKKRTWEPTCSVRSFTNYSQNNSLQYIISGVFLNSMCHYLSKTKFSNNFFFKLDRVRFSPLFVFFFLWSKPCKFQYNLHEHWNGKELIRYLLAGFQDPSPHLRELAFKLMEEVGLQYVLHYLSYRIFERLLVVLIFSPPTFLQLSAPEKEDFWATQTLVISNSAHSTLKIMISLAENIELLGKLDKAKCFNITFEEMVITLRVVRVEYWEELHLKHAVKYWSTNLSWSSRYEEENEKEVKDTRTYLTEDIDDIVSLAGAPLPHPFTRLFSWTLPL